VHHEEIGAKQYGGRPARTLIQREKMSPMSAVQQFQGVPRQLSNLDRCNRCGDSRSAHGLDWTCPAGVSPGSRRVIAFVVVAALLALAGVVLLAVTSTTATSLGSLGATVCLTGLTLLVCGVTIAGRRR
jgi:VIT1/CCC1 family predicted Fe2+/Mn2+ transporter